DVVFVPQAVSYVHIEGAVAWPGSYELGPDDTLGSLLEIAGGFARAAVRDTVFLHRFVDSKTTSAMPIDMADASTLGLKLADGDQVYVRSEHEWHEARSVLVEGEVLHPGPYGINEGADRLSDILNRAGGPTDRASLREARIVRSVVEDDPDREFERLGSVPVGDMAETELAYWKSRMRDEPGTVIADFGRALSGDTTHDALLLDGDTIIVPKLSLTVRVGGHVASPGRVAYAPGENYSYYVKSVGGFQSGARSNATRVIRSGSGEWVPAGRAGVLEPGDEVWVPERREGAFWRMLREVALFAASIATAYLLIDQATK
ncbi:MAG: SLBB domain-containing protein, partial [Candidatus Eisenbacteria bacterium]|nr:SLBB domain-containing protein [Candidatus Eisenbacteria bacterium]